MQKNKKEENTPAKVVSKVKPRIVADFTSSRLKNATYPPISDFEWPSYRDESSRILENSIKYRNSSIAEAFSEVYGIKVKKNKKKNEFEVSEYCDIKVGDIIPLRIKSIDKKNVHFYTDEFKEEIVCAVNLYQYKKFKEVIPAKPVDCKVISRTENTITVDPLAPLYDRWLNDKINNINKQWNMKEDRSILVKDLKLTRGGYFGAVPIDTVSEFVGQDVCVRGFIPGSHIVLNIESDFEKWNGKSVRAFITNYIDDKHSDRMSLICSAKEYQSFLGDKNKIDIFKEYVAKTPEWNKEKEKVYDGIITGVLNSSKKCGVFVEIPELHITTFVYQKADKLVNYKRGSNCKVQWDHFDEPVKYNEIGQLQHLNPYVIDNDILKKCYIKAVFKFVK